MTTTIDFAALAAGATVAATAEFPTAAATRAQAADPALVKLVEQAQKDGKRRELPGRVSTQPFEGRKGASEYTTIAGALHKAARQVGCKVQVRRFDADATSCRVTFRVAQP